jgi:hypothetical protein
VIAPGRAEPRGVCGFAFGARTVSRLFLLVLLWPAALLTAASMQTPGNASPGNASPTNALPTNASAITASPTQPVDPAAVTFAEESGLVIVSVKRDKTADYEAVIRALQDALSKATSERFRALAQSWRVFKAAEVDAKANTVYIHIMHPAVAGADYRPSLVLDEILAGASAELLAKYRDAIAIGPNKLGMKEFAHMVLPPPANTSPVTPVLPKKPGR